MLDEQVHYLLRQSLNDLGEWMKDHWKSCQGNKREAEAALLACGVDVDVLRTEWSRQVEAQTKPLPSTPLTKVS